MVLMYSYCRFYQVEKYIRGENKAPPVDGEVMFAVVDGIRDDAVETTAFPGNNYYYCCCTAVVAKTPSVVA